MKRRVIVGAIIKDAQDRVLLLQMPKDRGVYPGQWGIVGGGIDEGEHAGEALQREVREEVGLEITTMNPYWFHDEVRMKKYSNGSSEEIYMIYLLYDCTVAESAKLVLNDEWEKYAWVQVDELSEYDLNAATRKTFSKKGWL